MPSYLSDQSQCRLCSTIGPLCNSHILPNFVYKETIDAEGHPKMVVVHAPVTGPEVDKSQQSGYSESLLCTKCEGGMSKWETHVANKIWGFPLPPSDEDASGHRFITLTGINYKLFKLFGLSILWKASVARHRFFRCVDLGPHEAKVRRLLLDEDAGEADDYGCVVFKLEEDAFMDFRRNVFQPYCCRLDHDNLVLFCFRGYVFQYLISKPRAGNPFRPAFLSKDGPLQIFEANVRSFPSLCKLIDKGIRAAREWKD